MIKSIKSKTVRDYVYSPSVDRYLGYLDNDGYLHNVDWDIIAASLKVPDRHQFVHSDEKKDDSDDNDVVEESTYV